MSGALDGRVAVITGAGGGLGRAFAQAFVAAGARVVAADLDADRARETAGMLGGAAVAVAVDVADERSTLAMAGAAVEAFGAIDVLVNNAALWGGIRQAPFDELDVGEWDRVMAVNLRGPWLCARACAPVLRRRRGAIVNIASATALSGTPQFAHYVASKGGLLALTRTLARELGDDGVRVNAIAPGFTLTQASRDMIEGAEQRSVQRGAIKRPLLPGDVVGTAVFLASDAAAMTTGQTFVVDGGRDFL